MSKKASLGPIELSIVPQQTDSHCGPAVLQMLFSYLKKNFTQDQIVDAANAKKWIVTHGMQPEHMVKAVKKLAPHHQYWFKQHATLDDIEQLIHKYQYPVGVNWQGLFYDTEEEQGKNKDDDFGHYSIVIDIDRKNDKIVIADPYREYSQKPREFSLQWFEKRWRDSVEVINKKVRKKYTTTTREFIFIIVPKSATFPKKLGMQLPPKLKLLTQETPLNIFELLFSRSSTVAELR